MFLLVLAVKLELLRKSVIILEPFSFRHLIEVVVDVIEISIAVKLVADAEDTCAIWVLCLWLALRMLRLGMVCLAEITGKFGSRVLGGW